MSSLPPDDEPEATAEELALARELGMQLERHQHPDGEPALRELVETAALVRVSRLLELGSVQQGAIKADVMAAFERQQARAQHHQSRSWWARWWLPLPVALTLAAVVVLRSPEENPSEAVTFADSKTRSAPPRRELPVGEEPELAPSPELLQAQARVLAAGSDRPSGREARFALEQELGRHRSRLMTALDAKLQQ